MSNQKHCPECGSELHEAKGLAIWCPNDDCPVADDPDLWDGKGNRKEVKINWSKSFEASNQTANELREELQKVKQERDEAVELMKDAIPAFLSLTRSKEWEDKYHAFLNKIGDV